MITSKRQLIDEQTSPLHRIMWVYNPEELQRRSFENNICAFHIGNGYFLSVAHNLRTQAGFYKSLDEAIYQKEILYKLDGSQKLFMDDNYFSDDYTRKLYLNNDNPESLRSIATILKQKRFDTRWETLAAKKICVPYALIQFKGDRFYGDAEMASHFPPERVLYEPEPKKHTFMLPLELVEAFYNADIALYKVVGVPQEIINKIPEIEMNFDFLEEDPGNFHCLQSSPSSPAGRLFNDAHIEGILDYFTMFPDDIGGNYIVDGYRYLVKGYFRFGSSGAPYITYEPLHGKYSANGIQSEASGIQFSIKDDRHGNIQYTNAIVSPLYLIKDRLKALGVID